VYRHGRPKSQSSTRRHSGAHCITGLSFFEIVEAIKSRHAARRARETSDASPERALTIILPLTELRCGPLCACFVLMSPQCNQKMLRSSPFKVTDAANRGAYEHGKWIFFRIPRKIVPSPIFLAAQRPWAGLSGMRHLWDCLRI
jgi:hypothetical protein